MPVSQVGAPPRCQTSPFHDSLLDFLADDDQQPRTVCLASVHRPTFTQQLTVLHEQLPGFGDTQPPRGIAQLGRKTARRELDLPN